MKSSEILDLPYVFGTAFATANHRPSGDGMALQISGLVDLSKREALPRKKI
jgi:hypothetical protein